MTETDMWNVVIGFFMPLAVAFINQCRWPAVVKGLCSFAVCLIAAFITVYIRDGGFALDAWVRTALVVFLTAIATYRLWWNPSQIAPRIEEATTVPR